MRALATKGLLFLTERAWLIVLALAVAAWLQFPRTKHVETVRLVTTVDTVLHNVPTPVLKLVDRITYRTVPPETVLVSRQHTDTLIRVFCAAAQDTVAKATRLFLTAGRYDGTTLGLWGATTDERAYHSTYGARPPFEWAVSGDSVALHQRRVPLLRLNFRQNLASFLLGGAAALGVQKLLH